MFCPECGINHHAGERAAKEDERAAIEIERIHANRDIEVAKITARTAVATAETDNALTAAHAEGRADGMETALEGAAGADGGQAAELEEPGAPIVVDAPEPEPDPAPDMAPPVIEEPRARSSSASGGGWWDGYR